jgi:hypothetical protein
MVRSCTQSRRFPALRRFDKACKYLFYLLLHETSNPAYPLPYMGTRREIRMFDVKQLYIGGAIMACAEIITFVIMVATR